MTEKTPLSFSTENVWYLLTWAPRNGFSVNCLGTVAHISVLLELPDKILIQFKSSVNPPPLTPQMHLVAKEAIPGYIIHSQSQYPDPNPDPLSPSSAPV